MYKNFNGSSDYSKNVFELFKNVRQVNTRFNKDKNAHKEAAIKNRNINRKNVDLKRVKVDRDTSMRTSNRVVPGTIKAIERGLVIMIFALLGLHIWNLIMEYQLLIPAMVLTGVIVFCAYSIIKGINKVKKLFRR